MTRNLQSSRRAFIRLLAGAGTVALAGCASAAPGAPATPVAIASQASSVATVVTTGSRASAAAAAPAKGQTLVYYNWFTPADPQSQVYPHALDLFNQQHPGLKISNNVVGGGLEPLQAKLEVLIAGGTPPAVSALQWLSDLVFKDQSAPKPGDLQSTNALNLFMTGRLAMNIDITGTVSQVERQKPHFDWDLAHVPKGPKGRFTIAQGPSLAVFQASRQRDVAWQWVELYTGKEIQQYAAKVGRVVSARQSAATAYESLPPPPAHRAPLIDSAPFSRQRLFLSNWTQVNDVMFKNLDDALTLGTKTAQAAAQAACQQVTPLLTGE